MAKKVKAVRGTEVGDFLRCRQRWNYRWVEGIEPNVRDKKLNFGTVFHKILEWVYSGRKGEAVYNLLDQYVKTSDLQDMDTMDFNDLMDLLSEVWEHYKHHYNDEDSLLNIIGVEINFRIPMPGTVVRYEGTIDVIEASDNYSLRLWDHKTISSMARYEENSKLDRQISRYWWAVERLIEGKGHIMIDGEWVPTKKTLLYARIKGKSIDRFIYNLILKDVPNEPKILAKGELSKDKSQKTTLEKFLKVMDEKGIPHDDSNYAEVLRMLEAKKHYFFQRLEVFRTSHETEAAMQDFAATVRDTKKARIYRNTTYDCKSMCGYFSLCHAAVNGEDVNLVKGLLYRKIEDEKDDNDND